MLWDYYFFKSFFFFFKSWLRLEVTVESLCTAWCKRSAGGWAKYVVFCCFRGRESRAEWQEVMQMDCNCWACFVMPRKWRMETCCKNVSTLLLHLHPSPVKNVVLNSGQIGCPFLPKFQVGEKAQSLLLTTSTSSREKETGRSWDYY